MSGEPIEGPITHPGRVPDLLREIAFLKSVSSAQQAFFNAAIDRAEKAEVRVESLEAALRKIIRKIIRVPCACDCIDETQTIARMALRGDGINND